MVAFLLFLAALALLALIAGTGLSLGGLFNGTARTLTDKTPRR